MIERKEFKGEKVKNNWKEYSLSLGQGIGEGLGEEEEQKKKD